MKPIKFSGHNMTLAETQPEYLPLPVCRQKGPEGETTSCWHLTLWERLKLLFLGRLYLTQLTFNQRLQPQRPEISWKEPVCAGCGKGIGSHSQPYYECPTKYQAGARLKFYHSEFNDGAYREGTIRHVNERVYIECDGVGYLLEDKFTFVN